MDTDDLRRRRGQFTAKAEHHAQFCSSLSGGVRAREPAKDQLPNRRGLGKKTLVNPPVRVWFNGRMWASQA